MKKSSLLLLAALFLTGVFVYASYRYFEIEQASIAEANRFQELAELMYQSGGEAKQTAQTPASAEASAPTSVPNASNVPTPSGTGAEQTTEPPAFEPDAGLRRLHEMNSDLWGWITISGTAVDYPIMFTPDDPEFYLRRDFDKQDSRSGVPFLDGNCTEESDNLILYGHNMNDGSMFAALADYRDKDYYKAHRLITLKTLTFEAQYEVFSVFLANANSGFRYYESLAFSDESDFQAYIQSLEQLSLYSTGTTAVYGDKLLTLSTCSYHVTDGRLVVVAKQVNHS